MLCMVERNEQPVYGLAFMNCNERVGFEQTHFCHWFNGNFNPVFHSHFGGPRPNSQRALHHGQTLATASMGIPSLVRKMKGKSKQSGVYPPSLHPQDFKKSATYINVTIRDASEVVYDKVHSALRRINVAPKILPKLKGKVANKIATEASRRVPPAQIASVLSHRLPKLLMYQMYHKHGMTISAQTVFVEKSYIVVQLQVVKVDAKRLLATSVTNEDDNAMDAVDMKVVDAWLETQQQQLLDVDDDTTMSQSTVTDESTKNNNWLQSALGLLPDSTKTRLEGETLPQVVQTKLTERMQGLLVAQLSSKHLCGEIAVLPEEEQARFFFAYLQQFRKRHEDEKSKGSQRKSG